MRVGTASPGLAVAVCAGVGEWGQLGGRWCACALAEVEFISKGGVGARG